jgi:hypothetical protein
LHSAAAFAAGVVVASYVSRLGVAFAGEVHLGIGMRTSTGLAHFPEGTRRMGLDWEMLVNIAYDS